MTDKWKFTADDFNHVWAMPAQMNTTGAIASIANAKLAEWIAEAPVLTGAYGDDGELSVMSEGEPVPPGCTVKFRAICIEPIVRESEERVLLRKICDAYAMSLGPTVQSDLLGRARRLLGGK